MPRPPKPINQYDADLDRYGTETYNERLARVRAKIERRQNEMPHPLDGRLSWPDTQTQED